MAVDTANANILTDERKNRRNVFNEEYFSPFLPSGNFIKTRNLNHLKKKIEGIHVQKLEKCVSLALFLYSEKSQ